MANLKPMDRESMLREAERIHDGYVAGLNCAERVFLTVHAFIDTDVPPRAVAMLSGLGGGVGGTRDDICGAATGGVAAIGLIHGRPNPPEGDRERAYEAIGRVILEHSDLLMAIWDGNAAAGQGGTGQVVREALDAGLLVVHIDPAAPAGARLRLHLTEGVDRERPIGELARHVQSLLFPHIASVDAPKELRDYQAFLREKETFVKRAARRLH